MLKVKSSNQQGHAELDSAFPANRKNLTIGGQIKFGMTTVINNR